MITTAIDYPSILPSFRKNYALKKGNNISRTVFKSGFARSRKRFADNPSVFSLELKLDDAELSVFEAWRHWTLGDVGWFNAQLKNGVALESWVCRFISIDEPKNNITGSQKWLINFDVMGFKS